MELESVEKKKYIEGVMNYTGSKFKLLEQILVLSIPMF